MEVLKGIFYLLILLAVLIYTVSYAIFEFKSKNILAGIGVLVLCVSLVVIPVSIYFLN